MSGAGPGARVGRVLLALTLLASLLAHLELRRRLGDFVDPDEAVVGLMARHIHAGQSRPVFFYGQPYLGALEAWLGAASGLGDPPTAGSIRLVLVAVALTLGLATAALCRGIGGSPAGAALAAALVSLPAPAVLIWQLKFRGGFLLGAALLAGALALGLRALARPERLRDAAAFGLLAGLALWTNQLTLPAVAVFALALVARSGQRGVVVAGLLVGAAPLLLYNLVQPLATFRYLAGHAVANLPLALEHARATVTVALPNLLGGDTLATALGFAPLRWLGTMLATLGIGWLAVRSLPRLVAALRARRRPEPADLLLAALLLSLFGRRNAELNQLLHLLPLVAALLGTLTIRAAAAAALPAGLLLLALVELSVWLPGFSASPHEAEALVAHLEGRGIGSVRAEHRPAYLIAWHSGERIVASPALSYGYFVDRWPPYTERVEADPGAAWVLEAGSANEQRFRGILRAHGLAPEPEAVARYRVYPPVALPPRLLSGASACGLGASAEPPGPIALRVLLAGDAGNPWPEAARHALGALERDAADPRAARRVVVWLGDNVYPRGLPAEGERDPERVPGERVLDQQLDLARRAGAELVMVPGNHDWDDSGPRGESRVQAQGAYVVERGRGFARYLPGGACPGPTELRLSERASLVALDSEWLMRPPLAANGVTPLKPAGPGSGCAWGDVEGGEACGDLAPDTVIAALERLLAAGRQRDLVVVSHHPVRTWGLHGTRAGARPWSLLPCASRQDLCGQAYRGFAAGLERALRSTPRGSGAGLLLLASGHDHSLQVIEGDAAGGPDLYLISGTASAATSVKRGPGSSYASARHGYLRLDWLESGERWLAAVEAGPDGAACLAYEQRLEPRGTR